MSNLNPPSPFRMVHLVGWFGEIPDGHPRGCVRSLFLGTYWSYDSVVVFQRLVFDTLLTIRDYFPWKIRNKLLRFFA